MLTKQVSTPRGTITVNIPKEYVDDITEQEIRLIAAEDKLQAGESITIHRVVDAVPELEPSNRAVLYRDVTTKTLSGSQYIMTDRFVASVARGATFRLTTSANFKVNTSISGSFYDKAELGLSMGLDVKISAEGTLTGPNRGSSANSTEYRVRVFAQKYTWRQSRYQRWDNKLVGTKTGTAVVPTGYAFYSKDKYIR